MTKGLTAQLLDWIIVSDFHMLTKRCVFHYELELYRQAVPQKTCLLKSCAGTMPQKAMVASVCQDPLLPSATHLQLNHHIK